MVKTTSKEPSKLAAKIGGTLILFLCLLNIGGTAKAESINFDAVRTKAVHESYDLALSTIDTQLAKNKIREAKIPYYPVLNGSVNTEYIGGFGNQNTVQSQQAVVVGNTILPGNTRFQNAVSLNTNYTAYDFGTRANQLRAAKYHAQSSMVQKKIGARDLKLAVLDAYTQALLNYKDIKFKKQQLALQSQLYELQTRLWDAGKISRIELGEQAITLKNAEKDLQEARQTFGDYLNKLASYTHERYNVDTTALEDLDSEPIIASAQFTPNLLPDYKAYEFLIQEKQAEMRAIKAKRLPQVNVYGSFVLYGANKETWINAVGNLRARQMTMGIGTTLPIFDGFKTRIAVDEKKLEIARLITERDKKLWELRKDYDRSTIAASLYKVELNTKAELVSNSKDQLTMVIRLTESQVAEKTKALSEQIELITRQLDEEKTKIQSVSAAKRLRIYSET